MHYRLTAIIISFLFISCTNETSYKQDLAKFIPPNTSYILQSPNTGIFLQKLDSTQLFINNLFFEDSPFDHILYLTDYTKIENALLCFVPNENDSFDYLIISDAQPKFNIDSIKNRSLETLKFEDLEIKKLTTEGFTTFYSMAGEIFLASSSLDLLIKSISTEDDQTSSPSFDIAWAAADKKKTSLFINHKFLDNQLSRMFTSTQLPVTNLAEWSVIDIEMENNNFIINGVVSSEGDSSKIISLFEGVNPQPNLVAKITPSSAAGFFSFTYENFENLHRNLKKIRNDSIKISPNHVLNFTKEAGIIYGETDVFVLTTTDPELALQSFESEEATIEFRGITIQQTTDPGQFKKHLDPLIKESGLKYFASIESFLIFSESLQGIQNIITNFQNNTTLEAQNYYKTAITNLANSSSYLVVANSFSIKNRLKKSISQEFTASFENMVIEPYSIAALQLVKDQNFAHLHGVIKVSKDIAEEGVRQISSFRLDARPVIPPVLVGGNNPAILIQDINNNLFLYNPSGEIQWKKPLESTILKEIRQVELTASSAVHLAFTTLNNLHLIDVKGKPVNPFPVSFKEEITQPLGLFDYDNDRKYRLAVTQENNLMLYDINGKIVKGFEVEKTDSQIVHTPKHLRLQNKDYIIFSESSGKLNILSRQGNTRVKVDEEIMPAEQKWYGHKGKFVSATSDGVLVFVDQNGKVEKQSVSGDSEIQIAATGKHLAVLSENNLKINSKEIILDFGLYTGLKIFEINDKVFISVTDTQAQRVYIFDENGNLYEGFPVYGNSGVDMNIYKDGRFIMLVQGEEGEIILYQL